MGAYKTISNEKTILALMAIAAIALTSCEGRNHRIDEPDEQFPPENGETYTIRCTCDNLYFLLSSTGGAERADVKNPTDYKVYASGSASIGYLRLDGDESLHSSHIKRTIDMRRIIFGGVSVVDTIK